MWLSRFFPLAILWSVTLKIEVLAAGLTWSNCSTSDPPGLQCTTLQVPLNWAAPSQGNITLAIARLQALDQRKRIGSLFWNAGGPGQSAIPWVEGQASGTPYFTENLVGHFDIIGMDPRGIGSSTRIKCDPDIWNERVSYFPTTEAEYEAVKSHNRRLGKSCLERSGPLVGFMDTMSVARDMEAVRIALDDGKLNFLGISYASQLATQYAELFPDNFRAIAIDGNLDHSQSEVANAVIEASTYELVFTRFAKWCSETISCAFYGKDVLDSFAKLVAAARQKPIPAPGCLTGPAAGQCKANVTGEEILFNAQNGLLFKVGRPEIGLPPLLQGWVVLGQAISEALHGNATLLSSELALSEDSGAFGGEAVVCLDWTSSTSRSLAEVKYKAQLGAVVAPNVQ
jgi:pimeloyl-ACP methyl ester carboxylesterase